MAAALAAARRADGGADMAAAAGVARPAHAASPAAPAGVRVGGTPPPARPRSPTTGGASGCGRRGGARAAAGVALADDRRELAEEVVGHLLGRALDQPRADLRQLAADVGLGVVAQDGVGAVLGQVDLGAALGEAGGAALALAGDPVALGRVEVVEGDLAGEGGADRADLGLHPRLELVVGELVQLLAAGDRRLEDLGVVQRLPDPLAGRRDAVLAGHVHAAGLPPCSLLRPPASRSPASGMRLAYTGARIAASRGTAACRLRRSARRAS